MISLRKQYNEQWRVFRELEMDNLACVMDSFNANLYVNSPADVNRAIGQPVLWQTGRQVRDQTKRGIIMKTLNKQENVVNLYKKEWHECQYNLTLTVKHNMTNLIWDMGWYEPFVIKDGRAEQYNSIWRVIRTNVLTKIKDKVNEEI